MIGVDVVENERIEKVLKRFGERFLRKVFYQEEVNYCKGKRDLVPCVAGRWACKEAVIKAIYNKLKIKVLMREVKVLPEGESLKVLILREDLKDLKIYLTLSHERKYTVAVALIP